MRLGCNVCGETWYLPTPEFRKMTEISCPRCGTTVKTNNEQEEQGQKTEKKEVDHCECCNLRDVGSCYPMCEFYTSIDDVPKFKDGRCKPCLSDAEREVLDYILNRCGVGE